MSENGEHWTEQLGDAAVFCLAILIVLALVSVGWL